MNTAWNRNHPVGQASSLSKPSNHLVRLGFMITPRPMLRLKKLVETGWKPVLRVSRQACPWVFTRN